ncbi:MAG TPA: TetR family transcriptional regulator [Oscillospiraceae bacterium]|nr:TetR family transcriptional regulator [Oscillospiraceae bacterium]
MPKVNNEYFDLKKKSIIMAAINVCSRKPIYLVTMRDVITEAGLSKGGIYLYFSDIDDILIEVINSCNLKSDYRKDIDLVISESSSNSEALQNLLIFIGEYMQHTPSIIGKIQFELTVLYSNYPERATKILAKIAEQQSGQYFNQQLIYLVNQGIASGEFRPTLPLNDILTFVKASIDGIVQNQVFCRCYNKPHAAGENYDTVGLMKILAQASLRLLGNNSI